MKIIPLSEGSFTVDATKVFVPFNKQADELHQRPPGSLLVEIQPFCVVTSRDVIVIDTGLGFSNANGVLQIHQNLMDAGINPAEVTKVLMSHLHKDHSGGMSRFDPVLQQRVFSFPNAAYYVSADELSFATQKGAPSFNPDELEILERSDHVQLLTGSGKIDGYIRYEHSGGHSPWHQVFYIEEDGQCAFFGGDVAPQIMQMKSRFVAKYDYDGKKAMELRRQWWQLGSEQGWTFMFYHDIKTPVYHS